MSVAVRWQGRRVQRNVRARTMRAVQRMQGEIVRGAQKRTPVGTRRRSGRGPDRRRPGSLRASIRALRPKLRRGSIVGIVRMGSRNVFYARFIELGTKKMTAVAPLRRTLEALGDNLTRHVRAVLK